MTDLKFQARRDRLETVQRARRKRSGKRHREAKHVRLYDWLLDSPAYLSLTPAARSVLVEVTRVYDGSNNGRLALSVRRAAQRCRIAKDTAARAFAELQGRGFIECVKRGAFSLKIRHAAEWRLTWHRCDVTGELSRKPFMSYGRGKQNTVLIQTTMVP